MSTVTIKAAYKGDVRRITTHISGYEHLRHTLNQMFQGLPPAFRVRYTDNDGDRVTLASDVEFTEAVRQSAASGSLRLDIESLGAEAPQPRSEKSQQTEPAPAPAAAAAPVSTPNIAQLLAAASNFARSEEVSGATANLINRLGCQLLPQLLAQLQGINLGAQNQHGCRGCCACLKAAAPKVRHHGVVCDGCQGRIFGIRYKCANCADYDLCEACEAKSGVHNPDHVFLKIVRPVRVHLRQPAIPQNLYAAPAPGEGEGRCPWMRRRWAHHQAQQQSDCASTPCAAPAATTSATPSPVKAESPAPACCPTPCAPCSPAAAEVPVATTSAPWVGRWAARFIADVTIPDGSVFPPQRAFTKTWRFRNEGPTAWPEGCRLKFLGGERMSPQYEVLVNPVKPGEEVDVSVTMVSPDREDRFVGYWRMHTAENVPFGHRVWVDITVSKPAAPVSVPTPVTAPVATTVSVPAVVSAPVAAAAVVPTPVARTPVVVTPPAPVATTTAPAIAQLPVVQAPKQEEKPKQEAFKYADQLKHLETMGFVNVEANKKLLLKYQGNVLLVVQDLLEM
jgi:hypothetical protein